MGIVYQLGSGLVLADMVENLRDACLRAFPIPEKERTVIRYTSEQGVGMKHELESDFLECAKLMRHLFIEKNDEIDFDQPALFQTPIDLAKIKGRRVVSTIIKDIEVKYSEYKGAFTFSIIVQS